MKTEQEQAPIYVGPAERLRKKDPSYADLKLMEGFPPPACNQVTLDNWLLPPYNRWSYAHVRELAPTRMVKGADEVSKFQREEGISAQEVNDIEVYDDYGNELTYKEFLEMTACDGILILRNGKIVEEQYFNGYTRHDQHIMMSVTKSVIGTIMMHLIGEGEIAADSLVTDHIPELMEGPYRGKTVQQVMDMQIALQYSEEYSDPNADIWKYTTAMGFANWDSAKGGPKSIYEYLISMKQGVAMEGQFQYSTPNTDVLAWVAERALDQNISTIFSERIFSKLSTSKNNAYWLLDASGTEAAGAGLNLTLRDAARFGQMVLNKGTYNGEEIMKKKIFENLLNQADTPEMKKSFADSSSSDFAGRENWSYHNQWWMSNNETQAFSAIGVYGQGIYINPTHNIVIIRQSSNKEANNDPLLASNLNINNQVAVEIARILDNK